MHLAHLSVCPSICLILAHNLKRRRKIKTVVRTNLLLVSETDIWQLAGWPQIMLALGAKPFLIFDNIHSNYSAIMRKPIQANIYSQC